MLMTVEQLKKDAQISWRVPKLIKQSVSWWTSRNARSENEEGVVLLKEALIERAKQENLIFMFWKGEIWVKDGLFIAYGIEHLLQETAKTEKDLSRKLFLRRALEYIKKHKKFKFRVPFERLEVFCSFYNQSIKWQDVDIPWEIRVPSLLYLSLYTIGIEAYRLPPNLYEYTSPHELDLSKPYGGVPGELYQLKLLYNPEKMKAIETLNFPKDITDLSDNLGKVQEIALNLILQGKFSSEDLSPSESEENPPEDELPF